MPEATPVPEYDFEIRFRKSGKITVRAGYVQSEQAGVVLKSADHKIVFLAPPEVIRSVQRKAARNGHVCGRNGYIYIIHGDKSATPNQIRDLQDELRDKVDPRIVVLAAGSKVKGEGTVITLDGAAIAGPGAAGIAAEVTRHLTASARRNPGSAALRVK